MSKISKRASTPIENENDHNISESQKKHFAKFGYKPYLSYKGKIKWLSYEQHIYEKIKFTNKNRNLSGKLYQPPRHKKGRLQKNLLRFVYNNILLLVILALITAFLISYDTIIALLSNNRF